jgi:haloalkane dehalogenase
MIAIDGHMVHYVDEDSKDSPTLLFLHPSLGWSFTYRKHILKLRRFFRCVAVDFPGFGLSEAAEGYNSSLLEQSRFLERFVQVLRLNHITIWANDGAGPRAILAFANHTDLVEGLVVGGTFGWSPKDYPSVSRMLSFVSSSSFRLANRYANLFARSIAFALGSRSLSKIEKMHYTKPFSRRNSRNRPLKLFKTFIDPKMEEMLNLSLVSFRDKRVLIQFGENDAATKWKFPERWAREIPDSRTYILPKVKHFPFEDAPDQTISNFLEWWNEKFIPQYGAIPLNSL